MGLLDKAKKLLGDSADKAKEGAGKAKDMASEGADKAKDLAGENADRISGAVDKVTDKIDEKTGGKYHDKLEKVDDAVAKGAEKLAGGDEDGDA